jgi:hypothetical protein
VQTGDDNNAIQTNAQSYFVNYTFFEGKYATESLDNTNNIIAHSEHEKIEIILY